MTTATMDGWPCRRSKDGLVWRLWHSLLWRLCPGMLIPKGVCFGLRWANCPGCNSTICKEVRT